MDPQEGVAESTPVETDGQTDSKRDGRKRITLRANHSLQGKLTYGGHMSVEGRGRAEGDLRVGGVVEGEVEVTGDVEIDDMAKVTASVSGGDVNVRGHLTGPVLARKRLVVARSGALIGDVRVARLVIQDGATFSGKISMGGGLEAPAPAKPAGTPPAPLP